MRNEQELLLKATLLKQESEETENALSFVSEQIAELEQFKTGLNSLDKDEEKEILAPIGKGVYVKTKKEDAKFFVDVGAKVVVRKTSKETLEIVEDQIRKFNAAKVQLLAQLESYASQFREMLKSVEKIRENE